MKLEFNFNSRELTKAINKYPDDVQHELELASKKSAKRVERGAKQSHRFITRTGRLVKSIKGYSKANLEPKSKFFGLMKRKGANAIVELRLLDIGTELGTKYGKYVHGGHGSWSPDKFIEDSIERNKSFILKQWQEAVDKASKRF